MGEQIIRQPSGAPVTNPKPLVVCDRCGKGEYVAWGEIAAWTRAHPSKCSAKKPAARSFDGEQTTRKPLLRPSMPPRDPHATGCFGHDHDGEQTTERSVIVRDQHLGKVIKDEEDI